MAILEEATKAWAKIVARAWTDDKFKTKLFDDTRETLVESGLELDEGINISILEETPFTKYLVLPCKPDQITNIDDDAETQITRRCHSYLDS